MNPIKSRTLTYAARGDGQAAPDPILDSTLHADAAREGLAPIPEQIGRERVELAVTVDGVVTTVAVDLHQNGAGAVSIRRDGPTPVVYDQTVPPVA